MIGLSPGVRVYAFDEQTLFDPAALQARGDAPGDGALDLLCGLLGPPVLDGM
jgi:hypothetical protein